MAYSTNPIGEYVLKQFIPYLKVLQYFVSHPVLEKLRTTIGPTESSTFIQ